MNELILSACGNAVVSAGFMILRPSVFISLLLVSAMIGAAITSVGVNFYWRNK